MMKSRMTLSCCLSFAAVVGCATSGPAARLGMLDDLPRITSECSRRTKNVLALQPGQTVTLAELDGPGVIRHMWFTAHGGGPRVYKDIVLRVWWDGEPAPSINVPFGDFFGLGWGEERELRSLPVEMIPSGLPNHAALNCWWPMPFESARIDVEHQGAEPVDLFLWIINWERTDRLPADWGRFHAQWNRQNPVPRGQSYLILDARGRGRYVGTIMNYHLLEPGSWVEGGESFWIDRPAPESPDEPGEPTLQGIGSEDYFGLAWGYRPEFNMLFHGTSFGPAANRMTAYRFHIVDPIRFEKHIRVTMRCHGWDVQDRSDDYSSVALWYQHEPHEPFPSLPPPADRTPPDLPPQGP